MLFKFGDFDLTEYMVAGSYKPLPNARFDLDSYTDAEGVTHRNALSHTRSKITFNLMPMDAETMRTVMQGLVANYINYNERNAICTYFDYENWTEKTGEFYLDPNLTVNVLSANPVTKEAEEFGETSMTFTEY